MDRIVKCIELMRIIMCLLIFMPLHLWAFDVFEFPDTAYVYENKAYIVQPRSIVQTPGYTYLNMDIYTKKKFRLYDDSYFDAQSMLRNGHRPLLDNNSLRLIGEDSLGNVVRALPFCGMTTEKATKYGLPNWYNQNICSIQLKDREINELTLVFDNCFFPEVKRFTLYQNDEKENFVIRNIKIKVPDDLPKPRCESEAEIIEQIDAATDDVCGIYQQYGFRYACLKFGNEFRLYMLDSNDCKTWIFGDYKARFFETAVPNVFKGNFVKYRSSGVRIWEDSEYIILNGNVLEFRKKDGEYMDDPYNKIYPVTDVKKKSAQSSDAQKWSGTGFSLNYNYIVTNYHVVDGANQIEIYGIGNEMNTPYKATVVGKDKSCDLALLKLENYNGKDIIPPFDVHKRMADVGEHVFVLGYPLIGTMGEEIKLTDGIISSRSGFEGDVTNYQISVPIQPGNSGGPMFDEKGNLVGIVCAKHSGAENVGYAIKISYLSNLIESVAQPKVLPSNQGLKNKPLVDQIKLLRQYVYIIKCTK